jgi:hypothetical protein
VLAPFFGGGVREWWCVELRGVSLQLSSGGGVHDSCGKKKPHSNRQ